MWATVFTSDSSQKAIVVTLKCNRAVIIVHIMICPPTIPSRIRNGAITTLKIMDAIFLAVFVNAVPATQRKSYKS